MNNFLNHIIQRHTNPANPVMPRLRGIFEQDNSGANFREDIFDKEKSPEESTRPADILQSDQQATPDLAVPVKASAFNVVSQTTGLTSPQPNLNTELKGTNNNKDKPDLYEPGNGPQKKQENEFSNAENNLARPQDLNSFSDKTNEFRNHTVSPNTEAQTPRAAGGKNTSKPPTVQATPGSVVEKKDFQPAQESIKPSTAVIVNQNKPSTEVLSWARNIKDMINSALAEQKPTSQAAVIKVNIGRIDVRASTQQTPFRSKAEHKPSMSLDDFLKKKNGVQ